MTSTPPDFQRDARRRLASFVVTGVALAAGATFLGGADRVTTPVHHTLVDLAAAILALVVGALALARHYSRRETLLLLVGAGFIGTALLDAYHALAAAAPETVRATASATRLASWSWLAPRMLLGAVLLVAMIANRRREKERRGVPRPLSERQLYVAIAAMTAGTFLLFRFVPLPEAYDPAALLSRPQELVPGLMFGGALVLALRDGWQRNAFVFWLTLSVIFGAASQLLYIPFSSAIGDAFFDAAHYLKVTSYLCVLIGLFMSVYYTYRALETNQRELSRINRALQAEVDRRKSTQKELIDRKEALGEIADRLTALVQATPLATLLLDREERIRLWNPAAERMFGWSAEEVLGRPYPLAPREARDEFRSRFEDVLRGASVSDVELVRRRRDGTAIDVLLSTAPVHGRGGEVTGVIAVLTDITYRKAAERELLRAKAAAEDANRAKSVFLASMSHELRTPLNSVIGFTKVLLRNRAGNFDDQDLLYLERIRANGQHLLALINDLLDLSKIEAGRVELVLEDVDLGRLVRETVDQFEPRAQEKRLELTLDMPAALPTVRTDAGKLRQILINLVGNAIKFTEEGGVRIGVHPAANGAPPAVEVADTGIGIPPEHLDLIFDPFQQVDSGLSRHHEGTGLGLAICRRLCELLDCRLEVESAPGHGSTFRVVLPGPDLAAAEETPA